MHADLTRLTFDPDLAYRSVVMQQGRVLLDAEWNEQAAIAAHHDEARAADLIGPAGGPAPTDGGPGPFAIVSLADGSTPSGAAWADLGVTPGHYYADGVLAESAPNPATAAAARGAWPLADQPHLPAIGGAASGGTSDPGLPEPDPAAGDGRWAAYLDVFDHMVTADERPELLESALGGPDTAAREQTVWQVRVLGIADQTCGQLADIGRRSRSSCSPVSRSRQPRTTLARSPRAAATPTREPVLSRRDPRCRPAAAVRLVPGERLGSGRPRVDGPVQRVRHELRPHAGPSRPGR